MKQPDIPANERERLEALYRYNILDTPAEKCFDQLTELAANVCNTPVAMITFVDEKRDWFKSKTGISHTEAQRNISFCAHTILGKDLFIVPDTHIDRKFADNPLVIKEPEIRFYAGAPLITSGGYAVGAVCVIDHIPRQLTSEQQVALKEIAKQIILQLEIREKTVFLDSKIKSRDKVDKNDLLQIRNTCKQLSSELVQKLTRELELKIDQSRLAQAFESSETGMWDWDLLTDKIVWNSMHEKIFGFKPGTFKGTYKDFEKRVHADDLDKVNTIVASAIKNKQTLISEFRIKWPDKSIHWVRGHGRFIFDKQGEPVRMYGVVEDITRDKEAQIKLDRSVRALRVLNSCNAALSNIRDESRLLDKICRMIIEDGGYHFTWIGYPENDKNKTVKPVAYAGHETGYLKNLITWDKNNTRGRGPTGKAIRSGKPVIARDIANNIEFRPWRKEALKREYRSSIALPLMTNGKAMGLLAIYSREVNIFDQDEVKLLSELADNLARGIHSLRIQKSLEETRKQASQHLQELEILYDTAPLGYALMDKSCRYLKVNKELARMNGLPVEDHINQPMSKIIPGIAPVIEPLIKQVFKTGKPVSGLEINRWSPVTQSRMYWQSYFYPLILPDGKVHAVNTIVQDITDIKRAREELNVFHQLVQASTDYHSFVDRNYIYRSINDSYLAAFNKKRNEIVGHSVAELFGEEKFLKDIKPQMDKCLLGEYVKYELLEDLPGLGKRWSEIHFNPVRESNDIIGIAVNVRDVTNRKNMEYSLKISQEKYRALYDDNPNMCFTVNKEGTILSVNKSGAEHLEYEPDELIGKPVTVVFPDSEHEMVKKNLQYCIELDGAMHEWEIIKVCKNRKKIWVKESARAIRSHGNTMVLIVCNDITKNKEDESEILKSQEQLRNLAEKLHAIREDERTMISREIHDELGQSLTGLRIDLAWLLDEVNREQPQLADRTRKALILADETLETIRRISHDLRPAMLDDLGLEAAIEWQMEEFSRRTGCHYDLVLNASEIGLNQNRDTMVFRILQESLTNITRHANANKVHVSLEKKKNDLVMAVTDNGVGISDDALKSNNSIGLIGMRERAWTMGGSIDITRISNGGTQLVLSIPADAIHEH